jgi:hypothetical protein
VAAHPAAVTPCPSSTCQRRRVGTVQCGGGRTTGIDGRGTSCEVRRPAVRDPSSGASIMRFPRRLAHGHGLAGRPLVFCSNMSRQRTALFRTSRAAGVSARSANTPRAGLDAEGGDSTSRRKCRDLRHRRRHQVSGARPRPRCASARICLSRLYRLRAVDRESGIPRASGSSHFPQGHLQGYHARQSNGAAQHARPARHLVDTGRKGQRFPGATDPDPVAVVSPHPEFGRLRRSCRLRRSVPQPDLSRQSPRVGSLPELGRGFREPLTFGGMNRQFI